MRTLVHLYGYLSPIVNSTRDGRRDGMQKKKEKRKKEKEGCGESLSNQERVFAVTRPSPERDGTNGR